MREIKFRVWNGFKMYKPLLLEQNEERLFVQTGSKGIFRGDTNKQILSQFTGLKDKNGKDIYEGDIVKWGHAREWSRENPIRIAEVKINPDIQFHSQVGVFKFGNFAYADSIDKDLEVIGNIFENHELLSN